MTGIDPEEWRFAPEFPEYEVSSLGRVRVTATQRVKKPSICSDGYARVRLHAKARRSPYTFLVHRLVCWAFHGPCPDEHECAHFNGDKGDLREENLAWVTKRENEAHKLQHGTRRMGTAQCQAKLSRQDLEEIFAAKRDGVTCKILGFYFGVSPDTISSVCTGKKYASENLVRHQQ